MRSFFRSLRLLSPVMCALLITALVSLAGAPSVWGKEAEREKLSLAAEGRSTSGAQQQGRIDLLSFTVETRDMDVEIHSGLKLTDNAEIKAQLRDGAVMTLVCKLSLERVRTLLSNAFVSETTQEYSLRHDLLTREFVLSGPGIKSLRQKNFDVLMDSVFRELRFVLPLPEPLVAGENYRVHFDLTLQHAEVPPWLSQALFFWSWDVVPPVSVTQDFLF